MPNLMSMQSIKLFLSVQRITLFYQLVGPSAGPTNHATSMATNVEAGHLINRTDRVRQQHEEQRIKSNGMYIYRYFSGGICLSKTSEYKSWMEQFHHNTFTNNQQYSLLSYSKEKIQGTVEKWLTGLSICSGI